MGQLLSQPVTEKHIKHSDHAHLGYSIGEMQGYRLTMEDAYCETIERLQIVNRHQQQQQRTENSNENPILKISLSDKDTIESRSQLILNHQSPDKDILVNIFGVFDGHGGSSVSIYVSEHLPRIILKNFNRELSKIEMDFERDIISQIDIPRLLKISFLECDEELYQRNEKSGSTAIIMVLINDLVIVANTGDSRCILSNGGITKTMSYDHKPGNYGELLRIHQDGGYVSYNRVNGILALSRAFGDFSFKNDKLTNNNINNSKKRRNNINKPPEEFQVSVDPEILVHRLNYSKDEFVILACDGIWDCFTNKDLINFIRNLLSLGKDLDEITECILDECLKMANTVTGVGFDNMTIIIILLFQKGEDIISWYDRMKNKILDEKFGKDGH